jgi:hypothetical protein
MRCGRLVLGAVSLTALLCTEAASARMLRDYSGDAMQRHDSRMMESPLNRIPSLLGMSLWPFNPYFYAPPSLTVVNVTVNLPATEPGTPPASAARTSASPKFWTNHCDRFIEVEVSSATNLMEVEEEPCEVK